jgi:hypothetical protein
MKNKLERLNCMIGYLIFTGKLSVLSMQKEIIAKTEKNKTSVSMALNGDERYLTDKFIERVNTAFGSPFSIDWLLTGKGVPVYSNSQNSENNTGNGIIGNNVNGGGINDNKIIREMVELLKKKDEQIDKLLQIIQKDK